MQLDEALRGRRSIRRFAPPAVTRDTLERLVDSARWAPTAGNMQAWRFVVVTSEAVLRQLRMVAPGLMGAPPALIIVCEDDEEATRRAGANGVYLSRMDAAMAAYAITLEAYSRRLGTCIVASFNAAAVRFLLQLPDNVTPVLIISVGYPAVSPRAPSRRTDNVIFMEASDA